MNQQHQIYQLHIAGPLVTPAPCSYILQFSSGLEWVSWLSLIQFWLEAKYIFLKTSRFLLLPSSSPSPQQQVKAPQTPQTGASVSEPSWTTGSSSTLPSGGMQQQRRHLVFHHYAANAATAYLTQDAHLKQFQKTTNSKHKKQHVIECE